MFLQHIFPYVNLINFSIISAFLVNEYLILLQFPCIKLRKEIYFHVSVTIGSKQAQKHTVALKNKAIP
jgi:hypothetical protein